jgi:hypothetical protein
MDTPTDILNQLRNAWTVAAVSSGVSIDATTTPPNEPKQFAGVLLTGKTEPCRTHSPPFEMIDEPDKTRSGFIRSKCRHCGKFLGYRRAE